MLPDEAFQSYFLDVFGRPQRISACECERVTEANLAQALHLLNSKEIQDKLARAGGRADQMAKDARKDQEKIEELFIWAFARRPSQPQVDFFMEIIAQQPGQSPARLRGRHLGPAEFQGIQTRPVVFSPF